MQTINGFDCSKAFTLSLIGYPSSCDKKLYAIVIDLVTVFDAILTSRQTREKLQCLYENLMPNNFRRTAALKKM